LKLYLDVSCLSRPFDDQSQVRIRLESEAMTLVFQRIDDGEWSQVSSDMAVIEIEAIPNAERRSRVRQLLPGPSDILELSSAVFLRAAELEKLGAKPADAVHVAAAELSKADVFLSCDQRLCKWASRHSKKLRVRVINPLNWLQET
jgi:predicted nucleic acid-binding protein